ncbi:MAG: poly-gamma-glutamate synthase PgsB [Parcubacteria group bacterium]|nr:poly-gamma-glutamate synthase PgsB [Parcubacteria group bacterium]
MIYLTNLLVASAFVLWLVRERIHHVRRLVSIPHRIHVNGTRGKSSVTRLIAAILREAGFKTIGKVTGSGTNLIDFDGNDIPIARKGEASVFEQISVMRNALPKDTEAIVFECMAIRPEFQKFLEEKVMRSTIGVITNVREDHMDEMGYSLSEIAESLATTIPYGGHLVTAEEDPVLLGILKDCALRRGTQVHQANAHLVDARYLTSFPYLEHKENILIGLAVAAILGIPREVALKGMRKAKPDPGVLQLSHHEIDGKKIVWANLFAINDRESVIRNALAIKARYGRKAYTTVVILNNRADRPARAEQFAKLMSRDLSCDLVVTIGELETPVVRYLVRHGRVPVVPLAMRRDLDGAGIIAEILNRVRASRILLLGLANIHTTQAEAVLEYMKKLQVSDERYL